ncbi:Fpg/Nei family DNA glycosylase [Ruania halotolerans]|uniref:Fpg/Nei family DNA glycosylase n=1 Tax=Ruania halotolerans TaxID=2897773 RepID=UPI001E31F9F8|nr:DNA-formamidopyrimidine glycosylase family protein [Ruania halotolerans]UFU05189.1 Fpg/Nei family DNA glycosylase [Ruania halotolerans]
MPEMPEVAGLASFLSARMAGKSITRVHVAGIQALKTYDPPPQALSGRTVAEVQRHGKWLDVATAPGIGDGTGNAVADRGELHLVFHLSRAGWVRWYEQAPATPPKPGKSPIALRVELSDGAAFDLTEAGTRKRLAVYVVRAPEEVPQVASLGPDPLGEEFTTAALAMILGERRHQVKGVLRDQSILAGIGNAYSDEILHVARISPFAISAKLDEDEVTRLYEAIRTVLTGAIEVASGKPAAQLKDAKRAGMRVHGRTGQNCPECADIVREVSFADSSLQYCATCQTGGKVLADRRMSKLLR